MISAPPSSPASPPDFVVPAGRGWHWHASPLARGLTLLTLVCTAIAVLLALLFGGLADKLIHSFSIGLCCWGATTAVGHSVEFGRRRLAGLLGAGDGAPMPPAHAAVRTAIVLTGAMLGGSVGLLAGDMLTGHTSAPLWDWRSRSSQITLAVTLLGATIFTVVMTLRDRLAQAQLRTAAAQRQAAENQLRLLQSQLEPHMLFNTLANLRVLIGLDPARAQAMLDRLIAFLRATLSASRTSHHPLADEFARVSDYVALMEVRMGPRLHSRLRLPPELAGVPVPPLLLQPLVENAIKHGLEPQVVGGRLEVQAERDGAHLRLTVRDTGIGLGERAPGASAAGTHFGLQQVRERLHTLYGERAALSLQPAADAEGGTLAIVELPLPS
ncbi:MAG: histidine kinase [Rubrivivax sp.]|nr:histidine kinase [Rubrivivax sp.]